MKRTGPRIQECWCVMSRAWFVWSATPTSPCPRRRTPRLAEFHRRFTTSETHGFKTARSVTLRFTDRTWIESCCDETTGDIPDAYSAGRAGAHDAGSAAGPAGRSANIDRQLATR